MNDTIYNIEADSIKDLQSQINICELEEIDPDSIKKGDKFLVELLGKFVEGSVIDIDPNSKNINGKIFYHRIDYNLHLNPPIIFIQNNCEGSTYSTSKNFRDYLIDESGLDC